MDRLINILIINNNNEIDLKIIILLYKQFNNINYIKIYNNDSEKINTSKIKYYTYDEYTKIMSNINIVIYISDENNIVNLTYYFNNNIPIIFLDKNTENLKDVYTKFNNYSDISKLIKVYIDDKKKLLQENKMLYEKILMNKEDKYLKNIIHDIKKKENNGIFNIYIKYIEHNDMFRNSDYIECIYRNLKLKFLKKIYIYFKNDIDIKSTHLNEDIINNDKVVLIKCNDTFYDIIEYSRKIIGVSCILNSDIYINNNDELYNILNTVINNNNIIFCLSRIESDGNKYWEHPNLKNTNYSLSQDCWIYNNIKTDKINKNLIIGNIWNDIIFNNNLKESGYDIVNNGKSLPLIHLDTYIISKKKYIDPIRVLNNNIDINKEKYYLLPDLSCSKDISLDNLANKLSINNNDIYKLKCELMSKYIKINN